MKVMIGTRTGGRNPVTAATPPSTLKQKPMIQIREPCLAVRDHQIKKDAFKGNTDNPEIRLFVTELFIQ